MIYLDNNATTKPHAEVTAAVVEMMTEHWENPSSVHRAGQGARQRVELARRAIADLIGVKPRTITFTSGGTESIDLALRGAVKASGKRVVVTTAVEHAAVRDLCESLSREEGVEVRLAPVDPFGAVRVEELAALVDESVAVVSVQWANNETGVVQPVREIAAAAHAKGVLFHCDATQWVGKMPTRIETGSPDAGEPSAGAESAGGETGSLAADLLTFAPHKFHGPKGVGVLFTRTGVRLSPRLRGTQELGRRGGTENVPGIVGAGVAARLAMAWLERTPERERLGRLRDHFEEAVRRAAPDAVVNGASDARDGAAGPARLWNTTNIGFPKLEAEALLLLLSEQGVAASAGAACSSGSLDPSPVLLAMGVPAPVAHGSLRFSLSRDTTEADVDGAAEVVARCVERLRRSMTT